MAFGLATTATTACQGRAYPRGLGYGPPEINLLPAFLDYSGTPYYPLYNAIIQGNTTSAQGERPMEYERDKRARGRR